jgi:hypothetical protein
MKQKIKIKKDLVFRKYVRTNIIMQFFIFYLFVLKMAELKYYQKQIKHNTKQKYITMQLKGNKRRMNIV